MSDYRICGDCGAEYNAQKGHSCDKGYLALTERDTRDDAEVREREKQEEKTASPQKEKE